MQCAPAFNYARDTHITTIITDTSIPPNATSKTDNEIQKKVVFESQSLSLDLRYIAENIDLCPLLPPAVELRLLDLTAKGHKGPAASAEFTLREGQAVTFVLRTPPAKDNSQTTTTSNPAIQAYDALDKYLVGPSPMSPDDPYLTKVCG